jgi:hypothetical protein
MASQSEDTVFPTPTTAERASRLAVALACWFVAGCFLVSWWWPRVLDNGRCVNFGVGVLVFEFLTIHATAMLTFGLRQKGRTLQPRSWWWLVGFYALMAAAMAFAFKSWLLLISFVALLAGRVRALFHPEDHAALVAVHRRVAVSALLFLLLAFATVLVPMPAGGIDAALLREVWPKRGSGLWETHPQQALAMGFVYFLLLGWVEARAPGPRWYKTPLPQPKQGD